MSSTDESDTIGVLLLTAPQVAAMCQVSVDKVYEWAKEPGFPVLAGPHQLRIHARLFEEWLERRAMAGRQEEAEQPQEVVA